MMVKKKLKTELIKDQKALLVTYNKRKANLLKKCSELSILCGIDACIVILGPQLSHHQRVRPETWPSDPNEVRRIIDRFIQSNQPRRCSYVSDYFTDKKKKIDLQIAEVREQNYKAKFYSWHQVIDTFLDEQLRAFVVRLNGKLEIAVKRLQMLQQNQQQKVELRIQESSQLGHENGNGFFTNLLVYGGPTLPDSQFLAFRFRPENSQLGANLAERSNDHSYAYAASLPFNFEPVQNHWRQPLMEDMMMNTQKLIDGQNIPQSGITCVTPLPLSWMRNNYNGNPFMQPFQAPKQPNTPYQVRPQSNGNMERKEKGMNGIEG